MGSSLVFTPKLLAEASAIASVGSDRLGAIPANTYKIPFNRPSVVGRELEYCAQAVAKGHLSGDGYFTKSCHSLLEQLTAIPKVLLTTSCTHALEMSALLLNLQPGDEIIAPAFTFVTTVNAFVVQGAKVVFADIRPDTLNIDENQIESLITSRTRAIVPVHYGGVGCEMDTILSVAEKHGIMVIEDNAHGLFGKYRNKLLGTFGALATQSFHETKNFSCGEGGALCINDSSFIERAEIIREKGTDRSRFFRGQVDKYTWTDVGSSYLPSDLLAAYLYGQLEQHDFIQLTRARIWNFYNTELTSWASEHGVQLPFIPEHCDQSFHMYYLLLPSLAVRTRLIAHLKQRGILAVYHYLPLNISPMGMKLGGKPGQCPVSEDVSDRLLRLPYFNSMTGHEQTEVVQALLDFRGW